MLLCPPDAPFAESFKFGEPENFYGWTRPGVKSDLEPQAGVLRFQPNLTPRHWPAVSKEAAPYPFFFRLRLVLFEFSRF
jgi:hypothetical protein